MILRARLALFALSTGAALIAGILWGGPIFRREKPLPPRLAIQPARIYADGFDTATLSIDAPGASGKPTISIAENPHSAVIQDIEQADGHWEAQIRAGVMSGRVVFRVQFDGLPAATVDLTAAPSHRDSFADGTPDFLRLDDEGDRRAFRRWFTILAEEQYFQDPANRPPEIRDCAALIRYAYREALHAHESGWAEAARVPIVPSFSPVAKYQYPYTPLGAALFRVEEGSYRASDLSGGAFSQFADARTLWRYNTHLLGRNLAVASPGDLLFYRPEADHFHSMIYLGESQLRRDGKLYVLYHTGPEGADPGEIRRLTIEELLAFPRSEWRPISGNPNFLGVFRWNILRKVSESHDTRHL